MRGLLKDTAPAAILALLLIGLWQLYATYSDVGDLTLPPPSSVIKALGQSHSELIPAAWITLREILFGLLVGAAIALPIALALHAIPAVKRSLYPWLVVSQLIPIPAMAPLVVLWFGFGIWPKILVIAITSFFPIVISTYDRMRKTEPELIDTVLTLGGNRRQLLLKVELPTALPAMVSGLKIATVLATIGSVFAEWVGTSDSGHGLGYLILIYNNQSNSAAMLAAVLLLSVIGLTLIAVISLIERYKLP